MANIDDQLAYLRDALDGGGLFAREAIADALEDINNDRAYPFNSIKITADGDYEAPEGEPFTNVVVNIDDTDQVPLVDGFADRFTVKENKEYYSHELFDGRNIVITEFDVDVPQTIREKKPLTITKNGEYEAGPFECYNPVTVDLDTSHHAGDLLSPSFYYSTPGNPNFDAKQYIFTDHDVLFGTRAGLIFRRLPKLDDVTYDGNIYEQISWNPEIDSYDGLSLDQQFLPTWNIVPFGHVRPNPKTVYFDADVFAAVCLNKAMGWFVKPNDYIIINGCQAKFKYIASEHAGIQKTFWEWVNVDEIINIHYASSDTLLNTRNVINNDNDYYCWKHSLIRAFLNNTSSDLSVNGDVLTYNSLTSIRDILGEDIYNNIYPVTQYVNYAKRRDINNKFYNYKTYTFWTDYTQGLTGNYYYVPYEDIPVDPQTGKKNPIGLYQVKESVDVYGNHHITMISATSEYNSNPYYKYVRDDPNPDYKNRKYVSCSYYNETKKFNTNADIEAGFSNPQHTARSKAVYIDNGKAYRFTMNGNTPVRQSEYTFMNHVNYIIQHGSWTKKNPFVDEDRMILRVSFIEAYDTYTIPPVDLNLYYKAYVYIWDSETGHLLKITNSWIKCVDQKWGMHTLYQPKPGWEEYPEYIEDGHYWDKARLFEPDPVTSEIGIRHYNYNPSTCRLYDATKLPVQSDGTFNFQADHMRWTTEYERYRVTDTEWIEDCYIPNPEDPEQTIEKHKYYYMKVSVVRYPEMLLNSRMFAYGDRDEAFFHYYRDKGTFYKVWAFGNTLMDYSLWNRFGYGEYYPFYEVNDWHSGYKKIMLQKIEPTEVVTKIYTNTSASWDPEDSIHDIPDETNNDRTISHETFGSIPSNYPFSVKDLYYDHRTSEYKNSHNARYFERTFIDDTNFILSIYHIFNYHGAYGLYYYYAYYGYTVDNPITAKTIWNTAFDDEEDAEYYKYSTVILDIDNKNVDDVECCRQIRAYFDEDTDTYFYYNPDEIHEYKYPSNSTESTSYDIYKEYSIYEFMPVFRASAIKGGNRVNVNLFHGYYKHREIRHTGYSNWDDDYDNGAEDIYNKMLSADPSDFYDIYVWDIFNVIDFDVWRYSHVEGSDPTVNYSHPTTRNPADLYLTQYIYGYDDISNVKEDTNLIPYYRSKMESHNYIEDGDVYPNEPYYAYLGVNMCITNPFVKDEYTAFYNTFPNIYYFDDKWLRDETVLIPPGTEKKYCMSTTVREKLKFYDINEFMSYYGEYTLYNYNLKGMLNNEDTELHSEIPENLIYYADKPERVRYIANEIQYDCEQVTDKFLLCDEIWSAPGCLYPCYGAGYTEDELVIDSTGEYYLQTFLSEFFGIGNIPPSKVEKKYNNVISQHVNANHIYRYSTKEDYMHYKYVKDVSDFSEQKISYISYDYIYPTEDDCNSIYEEDSEYYDTVITQKKYELQGSFDASTGSSQIKHAYFFI